MANATIRFLDVFDSAGKRYSPREWFIAPLDVIEQAIAYVVNGEIVNMHYDTESGQIRYRLPPP